MPIPRLVTASVLFAATLSAQSVTGRWDCTVTVNGAGVAGSFFNGDERVPSTAGQLQEGLLVERLLGETTSATVR